VRAWLVLALVVAATVGVLTALTWRLLGGQARGAEIATVLALPVGVLAVVVPLFQRRAGELKRPRELSSGSTAEVTTDMAPILARDGHVLGVSPARLSGVGHVVQLPGLTPYLQRAHDAELREKVARTADGGHSALVVLVGDSTIGKTRALYEALREHPDVCHWPMAVPTDVDELNALLEGHKIVPGTVLWLDEIQRYLFGSAGAKAARGLRFLLNAHCQIIVVGTTWLVHSEELRRKGNLGDPNADARALLEGPFTYLIPVPDRLIREQRQSLALTDQRLADAVTASGEDGRVIQHLTGGPELLIAYRSGGMFMPVEHALITAAIDARRLGHHEPISGELLTAAADGYLSPGERPGAADWATTALVAITAGKRADGTHTDARDLTALRTYRTASGQPDAQYEPDDFLYQPISTSRQDCLGPSALWDAFVHHAAPGDLYDLGRSARDRGLYRYAALLWRQAVTLGDAQSPLDLIDTVRQLGPEAINDVCTWVARQAFLEDPWYTGQLLLKFHELGAREPISALLARDPAACVPPNDLSGCGHLLAALWEVGAVDQITTLLARDPAANVPVSVLEDDLYELLDLLEALQKVQAASALRTLADRITRLQLDGADWEAYNWEIVSLVKQLKEAGQEDAANKLAINIAANFPLDQRITVPLILRDLHRLKARDAVTLLADRAAQHAPYNFDIPDLIEALHDVGAAPALTVLVNRAVTQNPDSYTDQYMLLTALQKAGATEALEALARRAALDTPEYVASLLDDLVSVDAERAVQVLLSRDIASEVSLTRGTDGLLSTLFESEADDAVRRLLSRDPANQIQLDDPAAIAWLLNDLAEVGAEDAVKVLLARDPVSNVLLDDPRGVRHLLEALDMVSAHDAAAMLAHRISRQALVNRTPDADRLPEEPGLGDLLKAMHAIGATDAIAFLTARAAREIPLDHPRQLGDLLRAMHKIGASDATASLASRAACEISLDDQWQVQNLLEILHEIGAARPIAILLSRDPAAHVQPTQPMPLALGPSEDLVDVLEKLGASAAARLLLSRQANAAAHPGAFARLIDHTAASDLSGQLHRFGREPDSSPSQPWTWRDLSP
jgi:hypothetical protein